MKRQFILLMTALSFAGHSQTTFGVSAGTSISNPKYAIYKSGHEYIDGKRVEHASHKRVIDSWEKGDNYYGWYVDFQFNHPIIGEKLLIQSGLNISKTGLKIDNERFHYIVNSLNFQIPILLKYKITNNISISGGGYYMGKGNEKYKEMEKEVTLYYFSQGTNPYDTSLYLSASRIPASDVIGFMFGGEYMFKNIFLEARYHLAIKDNYNFTDNILFLGIGYSWGKKK